ncbi:hypothetical protein Halha_2134 [Halobacteroides halobius DSM 5150]|uniref:Uncharacterized protein n=1 Tax=Halobacteroides halobius (strain ATCC 35273 / DSM 5150 / MD-1) TaxID=748449 RepID=L0K9N7_HALHC|nr:hypothetical protein [Halobacteroides halobius]AGB42017.1 hypothetical protein Halha_2134 [Halobacteroides halobius DSM 5150]
MPTKFEKGQYLDYPCQGCGQKMELKSDLSHSDKGILECKGCRREKEYLTWELKSIINYSHTR